MLAMGVSGLTSCESTSLIYDEDDLTECEIFEEADVVSVAPVEKSKTNKKSTKKSTAKSTSKTKPSATASATPKAPKMPGVTVSSVSVQQPIVALTFDDGPHPTLTPQLLDVLKKYNAKATFFVLGSNVDRYPQIVARAAAEGHEIANHSYSHPILGKSGQKKVEQEMERTAASIEKACGQRPKVMRPPYGSLTSNQRQFVYDKYGYHVILWSVDTLDWKKPGASIVAKRFIDGAKPGAVMLGHDIHPGTIASMEETLSTLNQRGVRFVTVSELIATGKAEAASRVAKQP